MPDIRISEEDLPPGFVPIIGIDLVETIWELIDEKMFPANIYVDDIQECISYGSMGWFLIDNQIYQLLCSAYWESDYGERDPLISCAGWPLERPRPLIVNLYRCYISRFISSARLLKMLKTAMGIILFGDQNARKRRKLMSRISLGQAVFQTYMAISKKMSKMRLNREAISGRNIISDICLMHFLDLQARYVRREKLSIKWSCQTFVTHQDPEEKARKKKKRNQLFLPFLCDAQNLKRSPERVDFTEHLIQSEHLRTIWLDVSWTKDWPVVGTQ
ncbi:non-structural protein [Murre virus]|uniref:Non-structural protein n=2 Tax=Uukuvirus TaxID=2734594 RepID=L7NZ18_9VIRU|nr:non-structural protein [Murre virus]AFH08739.1 non-structural protein [Murre virus]AFH08742.1 nucleocapsid [RML-105355 virus]QLA47027.1 NSs [Sunday Canyon virus]